MSPCQAYKRLDDDRGKSYELGQSAVAGMRGVLAAWMRQSEQVTNIKYDYHCHFVVDFLRLKTGSAL